MVQAAPCKGDNMVNVVLNAGAFSDPPSHLVYDANEALLHGR